MEDVFAAVADFLREGTPLNDDCTVVNWRTRASEQY